MRLRTLVGWNEADGTRHDEGEIWDRVPEDKVPDLEDLLENGTIEKLPTIKLDIPPFKPAMETKEQK